MVRSFGEGWFCLKDSQKSTTKENSWSWGKITWEYDVFTYEKPVPNRGWGPVFEWSHFKCYSIKKYDESRWIKVKFHKIADYMFWLWLNCSSSSTQTPKKGTNLPLIIHHLRVSSSFLSPYSTCHHFCMTSTNTTFASSVHEQTPTDFCFWINAWSFSSIV